MAFGGGRGRWLGIPWLLGGRPRILRHPRGPRSKSLPCDACAMSGRTGGAPASDTHGCTTKHAAVPTEGAMSRSANRRFLRRTTEIWVATAQRSGGKPTAFRTRIRNQGRSTLLRNGSASDLDVKRNPVPRDASVEQNPTGSGIGLGARRPPGPVCFLEKSDWLKLVLVAGMPEPAR